jgi:hypothetical protein
MPRTRGTPEHRCPPGELDPPEDRLRRRLLSAETIEDVQAIEREAHEILVAATKRPLGHRSYETADERDERIVAEGEGWAPDDVAGAMGCRPFDVRHARLVRKRDPETGRELPEGDPFLVAAELRAHGRSTRVIERLTGIPRSTLRYRLGEP